MPRYPVEQIRPGFEPLASDPIAQMRQQKIDLANRLREIARDLFRQRIQAFQDEDDQRVRERYTQRRLKDAYWLVQNSPNLSEEQRRRWQSAIVERVMENVSEIDPESEVPERSRLMDRVTEPDADRRALKQEILFSPSLGLDAKMDLLRDLDKEDTPETLAAMNRAFKLGRFLIAPDTGSEYNAGERNGGNPKAERKYTAYQLSLNQWLSERQALGQIPAPEEIETKAGELAPLFAPQSVKGMNGAEAVRATYNESDGRPGLVPAISREGERKIVPAAQDRERGTWDPVTDARIRQLNPAIQKNVTDFINNAERYYGIRLRVTDAYRTVAQQDYEYSKGRPGGAPGPKTTNARGGESPHNYGLGFDVLEIREGRINPHTDWDLIGRLGSEVHGFKWGGTFSDPDDKTHFEVPGWKHWR